MAGNESVMLAEMRRLYDEVQNTYRKNVSRAITFLGFEVGLVPVYGIGELEHWRGAFSSWDKGWWVLLLFVAVLFVAAAVLFIITIGPRRYFHPPNVSKLIEENNGVQYSYLQMTEEGFQQELVKEYYGAAKDFNQANYRLHVLVETGMFLLVAGMIFLLIFQFFGV